MLEKAVRLLLAAGILMMIAERILTRRKKTEKNYDNTL